MMEYQKSKIKIVILIFAFYALHSLNLTTFAQESTPSADPLRQSDSEASIKTKLEELKKEIASKAAKLKQEVDRKLKDKAYVGSVKSVSENSLTLDALSGPKMVSINQDTLFESKVKGKSKFSAETLGEDDYVAALGDADETGVLIAKKVILLSSPPEPKTRLWGQIISISDKLLTIKDKDFQNIAVSLTKALTLKINDFVILTGIKEKNDIFEAGFIHIIPQGGVIKPKKTATPSAKVSTPSGKTSAKTSPKPTSP